MRKLVWAAGAMIVLMVLVGVGLNIYSNRQAALAERAVPAIGQFVEADGLKLHYVQEGEGPPIVLIHGLAGNLLNFTDTIVDDLARDHTVIVIDRPGSGYTDPLPGGEAGVEMQARFIHSALNELGVENPILLGHSLGGAVSLAYALEYPDETAALVLVAPATAPFDPEPPTDKFAVASPFAQALISRTLAVPASLRSGAETVEAIFAPDAVPSDFATAGGAILSRRPSQVEANFRDFSQLQDGLRGMQPRYLSFDLPIRVVFGTKDAVLDPDTHIAPLSGLRNAEVARIDGKGHMLIYSAPDQIAAAVRSLSQTAQTDEE